MEKVIPMYENDILQVTQNLKTYLEATFDFVYNHNDFFIVGNNDIPLNSLPNTTGEVIWLKMIDYVKDLMIEPSYPDASLFYGKLSTNFILAYGTHSFLNDQYEIILDKFNRKLVPIYNESKLDYTYLNNDISITKLDTMLWKPVGYNKKYNTILETILKLIFDTLNLAYSVEWSFKKLDNLYIILNRDVEDGYHIPISYEIPKALKNYIYQVWILMINNHSKLLSPQQKRIEALLQKYKRKGIPLVLSDTLTRGFEVNKKIIYRDRTVIKEGFSQYFTNNVLYSIVFILSFVLAIVLLKIFNIM
tara:strand:+ start:98 stop:1012 length:915 start_codon:yes stop_codon:yes gene_type:complete